jgi:hypothetical protein
MLAKGERNILLLFVLLFLFLFGDVAHPLGLPGGVNDSLEVIIISSILSLRLHFARPGWLSLSSG